MNETGALLEGACVRVTNEDGSFLVEVCDNDHLDGFTERGVIALTVVPGTLIVRETRAPDGYGRLVDDRTIVVGSQGRIITLTHHRE